ncbi:SAM-dependent methyltransferase [Arenimonas composti]|uniref:Tetrapyrrole methylase domain-containing protein n=1 Tax=Arenimonas composti TR7-09 = DSM 18010 TaxID=1121013 RepID=A0A091BF66_9GAMM|nr:SAM-dependent methyltransferase [Arenimonas composti]KFN49429.1 hypothetical protein P873_10675 [Arenimonas composti TR7-09 = DSM 18010]
MQSKGSLAIVGVGMTLGAHITPRARSRIENADVVFVAVSDPVVELWVQEMHPDVRSLQPLYGRESGEKSRQDTYREMVGVMLAEVRAGQRVCGAFYGHPGVFALAPHRAVEQARAEGYEAVMEPGVSAEDCLYADLGIDPGRTGCQHFEASQMMFYRRRVDPGAWLVVWQPAIAGDRGFRRFATGPAYLQVLVDVLAADYPLDHPCTIYEAATLPIQRPRIEQVALRDLPQAALSLASTLVLPPARPLQQNPDILARLAALDAAG